MLKALINRIRSGNAQQAKPSILDRAIDTTEYVLQMEFDREDGYYYHSVSQKEKDELKAATVGTVRDLFVRGDPIAALRLVLVNYAIDLGDLVVLSTTPDYAMFKGISGELRERVAELSSLDDGVRNILDGLGVTSATQSEMVSALNNRFHFLNVPFLAYGAVRIILGDYDDDDTKDWFRPLCISCQIHAEDTYRMKLGMPTLLDKQIEAIVYSSFPLLALDGHKNPREEWEKRWVATFDRPSPFHGIAP